MKNKKILMIITIITLISFIIGFSYAYFTTIVIGNDTASSNITTSGSLKLTYNGTDYISLENSQPGDSDTMSFTVTNTGSLPVNNYDIYLSNLINTFINDEVVYEIECLSSDAVSCSGKTETPVPAVEVLAISQGSIAPGTTHTYTLTVTFIDTGLPQDYNQEKEISFKVTINEQTKYQTLIAAPVEYYETYGYFWDYKYDITSITFEDSINTPVSAFASWDVSVAQSGGIIAYIIDDGLGANTYELHIQSNDLILANPNSSQLFYGFYKVTEINNLFLLNTINVFNMYEMFFYCTDLISLDLSNFNTSDVITMAEMFWDCDSLTSLDLSTFDTSNVTDMYGLFCSCNNLLELDLNQFNTNKVTDMGWMFAYCSSLVDLDLTPLNTSKVTNMYSMFSNCNSLTSLDLSPLNTSKVRIMFMMFSGCSSLTTLDLSTFETTNVETMSQMFAGCYNLISLDLSSFVTYNVTDMYRIFYSCSSLLSLDFRNADFGNVTNFESFINAPNGINIVVKDVAAQTFINARLTDASKTGNVTIYV